jgi:glutathione peroxidase
MSIYAYTAMNGQGEEISMRTYEGKVLLIVNTASLCGFTSQYDQLQKLYEEYQEQGLEILGFPCNQFRGQEPGTDEEIAKFCSINYGVTFPLFAKVDVNGSDAHPLFQYLKKQARGFLGTSSIKWNFTKFLVNRSGNVVRRYSTAIEPKRIEHGIKKLL